MVTAESLDDKIKKLWPKDGPETKEIAKYIKKYSKEKIVIKCGGRVLLDPNLFNNFIEDIAILKKLGLTPIVVQWLRYCLLSNKLPNLREMEPK